MDDDKYAAYLNGLFGSQRTLWYTQCLYSITEKQMCMNNAKKEKKIKVWITKLM